jgi:hypothetical protein
MCILTRIVSNKFLQLRHSQEVRCWIQVLKELMVVLEEPKVLTSQEISEKFMCQCRHEQLQPLVQLKEVNNILELKLEINLEALSRFIYFQLFTSFN